MRVILGITSTMLTVASTDVNADEVNAWQELSPLPDAAGYGGMAGGVLEGNLVVAGGSYFDKPLWLQGQKHYSDKIYVLGKPEGSWSRADINLPYRLGHSAYAQGKKGLIIAGGINDEGVQSNAFLIELKKDQMAIHELSPMPQPNCYGAGAVAGDYFYVVGGAQSELLTSPTSQCWRLSMTGGHWERMPDLPGRAPLVPAASSDGTHIYVFGGIAYPQDSSDEPFPTPLTQVFRFDPESKTWTKLADLPEARVAPCASPAVDSGNAILLAGGYADVHQGLPETHPGFSQQTLVYRIDENRWLNGPPLPKTEPASRDLRVLSSPMPPIAAPCVLWHEKLVLIGGEVLPSVRSSCVLALPINTVTMDFWNKD